MPDNDGTSASIPRPTTARVAVIGEALVDLVVTPDAIVTAVPGGGPFNAARTLARLEIPTSFVGAISADAFGDLLHAGLRDSSVDLAIADRVDAPTTLAIAQLDGQGSATYRFLLDGTSAAAVTPGTAVEVLGALAPAALHVGTLGLVLAPLRDATLAAIGAASEACLVFADPNCRPAVVRDRDDYLSRLDAVLRRADVVKLSTEDAEFLAPGTAPLAYAAEIVARGPSVVLLTDGGNGVHMITERDTVSLDVPRVTVVDTVGAGDSFGGGFLAWWLRRGLGREALDDPALLAEAVSFGIRVAALTCQRPGADPPRLSELGASG